MNTPPKFYIVESSLFKASKDGHTPKRVRDKNGKLTTVYTGHKATPADIDKTMQEWMFGDKFEENQERAKERGFVPLKVYAPGDTSWAEDASAIHDKGQYTFGFFSPTGEFHLYFKSTPPKYIPYLPQRKGPKKPLRHSKGEKKQGKKTAENDPELREMVARAKRDFGIKDDDGKKTKKSFYIIEPKTPASPALFVKAEAEYDGDNLVSWTYTRKRDGKTKRYGKVAVYERKGPYLFATHGGHIKKFITDRVRDVDVKEKEFEPEFEVKTSSEEVYRIGKRNSKKFAKKSDPALYISLSKAEKGKYGRGKRKQEVLVHGKGGRLYTAKRTVGTAAEEQKVHGPKKVVKLLATPPKKTQDPNEVVKQRDVPIVHEDGTFHYENKKNITRGEINSLYAKFDEMGRAGKLKGISSDKRVEKKAIKSKLALVRSWKEGGRVSAGVEMPPGMKGDNLKLWAELQKRIANGLELDRGIGERGFWNGDVYLSPDPKSMLQVVTVGNKGNLVMLYTAERKEKADIKKNDTYDHFVKNFDAIKGKITKAKDDKWEAFILWSMMRTGIRIGGKDSETRGESTFGLSTLQNRHVKVSGSTVHFHFPGKGRVGTKMVKDKAGNKVEEKNWYYVKIKDPELAREFTQVKALCSTPSESLFHVSAEEVRKYLHDKVDSRINPHDFRRKLATDTAALHIMALHAKYKKQIPDTLEEYKAWKKEISAIVGERISDGPKVAWDSYIMNGVKNRMGADKYEPLLKKIAKDKKAAKAKGAK